jgi:hypothetical protein
MATEFVPDPIGLEVHLQTDPELAAELLALAERGATYARSIAPVGDREHVLASGYVDKPGDYRDGITASVVQGRRRMVGRVSATDYKAHRIEYGTAKMPKNPVIRRTAEHLEYGGG